MYRSRLALTTFAACLPLSALSLVHIHGRDLNAPLLDSYDYIVVGCGISGLVVTNRLSEDPSVSVLCIEAGDPDQYEPIIQNPVYVGADIGGIYDWLLSTTPQTQLDGAPRPMPQGKVLGGGSILNAMCWNRGGQDDYNAWAALGNPGWDWEGMLPYFIKSETYTPVYSAEIAREYSINYNPLVHGTSGPVQVSYPRFFYPQSTNLFAALNYLGVPTQYDPNDGSSAGAAFVPTDLDPVNQTRSDARRTYYDPYVSRPNFHVITGQHVTRILIEGVGSNFVVDNPTPGGNEDGNGMNGVTSNQGFGFGPGGSTPALENSTTAPLFRRQSPEASNLRITGVEFAARGSDARTSVTATREVIVAAGALHSAQLLQLSGIGPSSLLDSFDIPIALDLPGVGNNLQDHCLVGTFYPYNNASYPSPIQLTTNATYNAAAELEYNTFKTGPWTAGSPNALAFNPLPLITNNSASILSGADDQDPTEFLPAGLDPTLVAGYTLQKESLVRRLAETNVASYEIINNNAGSLTLAVMHPFSRGQCYIRSPDPFEPPSIDPRWLTNPVDRQVLIEALLFNRQILATPAMLPLQAAQFVPTVDDDEEAFNRIINTGIRTEFHPSGTCAMLPLEQGGVVDPRLRVYGAQNLRVVDAGIFPMIPAAHLQAVVYAVAEKAADIIKADNFGVSTAAPSSSSASASSIVASFSTGSNTSSALSSPTSSSATSSSLSTALTLTSSSSTSSTSALVSSTISSSSTVSNSSGSSTSSSSSVDVSSTAISSTLASSSIVLANSTSGPVTSSSTANSISETSSTIASITTVLSSSWSSTSSGVSSDISLSSSRGSTIRAISTDSSSSSSFSTERSSGQLSRSSQNSEVPPSVSSSIGPEQTSTRTSIVDTTSYDLPSSYSLPSSYPLPTTYDLPSSYPLPTMYTLPSSYPLPSSYNLPSSYLLPTSYDLPSSYPLPTSYDLPSSYPLPTTYDFPTTISYNLPSSISYVLASSDPASLSYDPPASDLPQGRPTKDAELVGTPSPPEITPLVVASLPSSLVQILSSLSIPAAVTSAPGVQITVGPVSTLLNPAQLSSSVQHALTSGGIPSSAASALVPVILGSYDSSVIVPTMIANSDAAAATLAAEKMQRQHQASIEAFVQWLLHFFHLT